MRGEKNGVYDLAEWDAADGLLTYGTGKNGIVFSGTANKTNQITADDDVTAARVTLDSDTVIVVASGSRVGVRIGKQSDASSVEYAGKFLSANSDLIVFVTDKTTFNPETWGQAITSGGDETWYMATVDTEVETDVVSRDSCNVTVTNLIDLRTMKTVKQISYTVDSVKDAPVDLVNGDVLYMSARGEAELYADGLEDAFVEAVKTNGVDNRQTFTKVNVDKVEFIDDSTIRIDELRLDGVSAVAEINATVLTLDLTDYNTRTYDYNNMALDIPFDEKDNLGNEHAFGEKYEYALDGDMVEEIAEPRSGVLDQLVIASNGETILIPKADADDFRGAMEATVQITMLADVDDSVVTLYVLKVLYPVD